jgi:glycosyltransferase involved in cell wall biosynthesis
MPRITIGMPVYNGEQYIQEAIADLQAQTHDDFQLVIADNASTDTTESICRELAGRDKRIIYHRHERNLGWARNFNYLLERNKDEFFKWAASDDRLDPRFLQECLRALKGRPDCIAGFSRVDCIDEDGRASGSLDRWALRPGLSPHNRVRWAIWTEFLNEFYAVFRAEALRACEPMAGFLATDRVMIADAFLRGDLAVVDSYLLHRRSHSRAYSAQWSTKSKRERLAPVDPDAHSFIRRTWIPRVLGYMRTFRHAPISRREKLACAAVVFERPFWSAVVKCTGSSNPSPAARILGLEPAPDLQAPSIDPATISSEC